MIIKTSHSSNPDGAEAVHEITRSWANFTPDFIIAFHSTQQDVHQVMKEFRGAFPDVQVVGCTTAGEHLNGDHYTGSLVACGIQSDDIRWSVGLVPNAVGFTKEKASQVVENMTTKLNLNLSDLTPDKFFCLMFHDGTSRSEEKIGSFVAESLEGIPLIGGSAGDDLQFSKTYLFAGDTIVDEGAVLVLVETKEPYEIIKHQHFVNNAKQLVVTKADSEKRVIYELDGYPAKRAYANALGVPPDECTADLAFDNPFIFRANNELYLRSIQMIEPDDSMICACGVEEGMVLELADHKDMVEALSDRLSKHRHRAEVFIAFNCVLRVVESNKINKNEELGRLLMNYSNQLIGFDTYGEQLNGLHMNQSLVGLWLGRAS